MRLNCISRQKRIRQVSAHGKRLHRKRKRASRLPLFARTNSRAFSPSSPSPFLSRPLTFPDGGISRRNRASDLHTPPTLVNLGYDPPGFYDRRVAGKFTRWRHQYRRGERGGRSRENSRENNDYSLERLALPPDVSE